MITLDYNNLEVTYANFHQMYELVYKQMEEAGVAVRLETPQW
jgi:hypothetical protein